MLTICIYIWILILSLQAAITTAAHGRVGNRSSSNKHTTQSDVIQCSNPTMVVANFPLQTNQPKDVGGNAFPT